MKEFVEIFRKHGLLFKELASLDPAKFGIKKRIRIFEGVDLKNRYTLIVFIERKSRFLQKDALALEEIAQKVAQGVGHAFAKKMIFIKAPLCSKAKELLKQRGFDVVAL